MTSVRTQRIHPIYSPIPVGEGGAVFARAATCNHLMEDIMPLIQEEKRILKYLQTHPLCPFPQLLSACLPGSPAAWAQQILANLEWLGYVNIFPTQDGQPPMLQLTSRGQKVGGLA